MRTRLERDLRRRPADHPVGFEGWARKSAAANAETIQYTMKRMMKQAVSYLFKGHSPQDTVILTANRSIVSGLKNSLRKVIEEENIY